MSTTKKYRYVYKDAKTWEFVTEEYAKRHPATTVKIKIEI